MSICVLISMIVLVASVGLHGYKKGEQRRSTIRWNWVDSQQILVTQKDKLGQLESPTHHPHPSQIRSPLQSLWFEHLLEIGFSPSSKEQPSSGLFGALKLGGTNVSSCLPTLIALILARCSKWPTFIQVIGVVLSSFKSWSWVPFSSSISKFTTTVPSSKTDWRAPPLMMGWSINLSSLVKLPSASD